MRLILILPTADIVDDFEPLDHFFTFHEGGIKEIIKDYVLAAESLYTRQVCDRNDPTKMILEEFLQSGEYAYQSSLGICFGEFCIESILERLEKVTSNLLDHWLAEKIVRVDQEAYRWVGNDLMILVEVESD